MTTSKKLLDRIRANPKGLSFKDFKTLLKRCGWVLDHQTGSHEIWYSKTGLRLSIQNRKGKAKDYQVKQFLILYDKESSPHEKI